MVIDTSALLAIAFLEPEVLSLMDMLDAADRRLISAASVVEAGIVVESRAGVFGGDRLDKIIVELGLEIEPVTADQARIARFAYRSFGKGNHPAGLNFGDCFAYALAKAAGMPLLFKGDDFAKTDVLRL
jgi:ribonuclease VapC